MPSVVDYVPPQTTEIEPGGHEDCTWAAGVMLWNAANARQVAPSTRAEYEALRVAGGDGPAENPGDGSNLGQLQVGMQRRYGWAPTRIGPPGAPHPAWHVVLGHLEEPGDAAVVQGWMGVFPRNGHWRRWDPQFGGAHAAYVQRRDKLNRVWWMNPSAPNTYAGEWMPLDDLRKYYDGWSGGAVLATVGQLAIPDTSTEEPDMPGLATHPAADLVAGVARIPAGVALINVETSERVEVGDPKGAVRQAVGPMVRDFGDVEGWFVTHGSPAATFWVAKASVVFTPNVDTASFNAGATAASKAALTARR